MRGKKYIFFDLDGTLIDPRVGITGSVIYALNKMGEDVGDPEKLTRFIGPPLEWGFKEYCGFDDEKAILAASYYREYFAEKGVHQNEIYDGIIPMLEKLSAGSKLVIASSKREVFVEQIADSFDFSKYFDAICGSMPGIRTSDKAEVMAYAMERCGCLNPDEIVMVGDRMHDIIGAKKNNMESIGVMYGYAEPGELAEAGADYIAETVQDLTAFLADIVH